MVLRSTVTGWAASLLCCLLGATAQCYDSSTQDESFFENWAPPPPCSAELNQTWVVGDSAEAQVLAEAINCSGGSFEVEWIGRVVVEEPIQVAGRTVLTITGAAGSPAAIDGNNASQLFFVVDATLHVADVNMSYGNSTYGGGALAAVGSNLTFDRTNFVGNSAPSNGGAVCASGGSSVSFGGGVFADNVADYGGAMYVSGSGSTLSWNRDTFFNNNIARVDGGALYIAGGSSVSFGGGVFADNMAWYGGAIYVSGSGSTLSWNGATYFHDNIAVYGGALCIDLGSTASWSGEINSVFDGNRADEGGAIHVSGSGSTLSWNSDTIFTNNSATSDGGALCANDGSTVSWSGDINCDFDGNQAIWGGAIFTSGGSHVSCSEETNTTLSNNLAHRGGGAMMLEDSSRVSFAGNTSFDGNNAAMDPESIESGFGGALAVRSNSAVNMAGRVSFNGNSARQVAGALYVDKAIVSWSGNTSFTRNTAQTLAGGAMLIWNESYVSWTGTTEFAFNEAGSDGGAIGSPVIDTRFNLGVSTLSVNGPTIFSNNTCGANGGALSLYGGLSVLFDPAVVHFENNSANVSGGAVFVAGAGVGVEFNEVSFISNSAQIGGAVSTVGSGILKEATEVEPKHPMKFDRCRFIGNLATATGGAIQSAAGQDEIVNSMFKQNRAGTGGAVRLAGTVSLDNCSFVENVSDDGEGAAVSNIGSISIMTNISFSGNEFDCQPDKFLNFSSGQQEEDLFAVLCGGCNADCDGCSYDDTLLVPKCDNIMDKASSLGGNTTLETICINEGYWRANASDETIRKCHNEDACLGGVTGSAEFCATGYKGPYCSICKDDYATQVGFTCAKCSTGRDVAVVVLFAVAGVLAAAAVASYVMSGKVGGFDQGLVERVVEKLPIQSGKIVIVAWQILTQFASVANITFGDSYEKFLDAVNVFNFDLSFTTGCLFDATFYRRLLFSTITPVVALVFLAGTYTAAVHIHRGAPESLQNIWHKHVSMVLLLTFLVYSSVSSILFETFACEPLEDGKKYVRADYRVQCDSSEHGRYQIYAGFMMALYTAGIPALYFVLLFRDRDVLRRDKADRDDPPSVTLTSGLWEAYRPSAFYYELIECARRVLLTGVIVFIFPNSAAQVAVTLMIAFVFVIISEVLSPYSSIWDTWINRLGHLVVYVSMYVALLLKVDVSDEQAGSQEVFEAVLIAAHVCMVFVVVAETCVMMGSKWAGRAQQRDGPAPRPHRAKASMSTNGGSPFGNNDGVVLSPVFDETA